MNRFVCVHGHFYQPPRENPWLEAIELQDSAYPFHDWNTRITHECYGQNAASRILDRDKKIVDIVNNYSRMSFNFGPTLMYWLADKAPDVYEKILEADRLGQERFSGHGPALAQPYNHMIMPLCNARDKYTQILWGIRDFEFRFHRAPEGMWLPETAVDLLTLEILADLGIRFTLLSPTQAKRVKRTDGKRWKSVTDKDLDTTIPYRCYLPSGKSIVLFFYHGPTAHGVAYGGLLHNGEAFADRLMEAFPKSDDQPRLVHIATDGESFGHHHRHGDMALAYCLHQIESQGRAQVTIYGEYLDQVEVQNEVEIHENSSWSCAHGVERWKSNCGCCGNQALSGKQGWRAPLRQTLDWLRDYCIDRYEQAMTPFNPDPWAVRNAYIRVIHDRLPANVGSFIIEQVGRELTHDDEVTFLKLLEIQRNCMLMYTSCGWFFDDISGIETVQIMQYAARAMQLCQDVYGDDLEPEFKSRLETAPANIRPHANGRQVYESSVQPARVDLKRVGAHVALSSVFSKHCLESVDIYCFIMHLDQCCRLEAGAHVLVTSRATIESKITHQLHNIDLAVFYLGDHHLFGTVRYQQGRDDFTSLAEQLQAAFRKSETNEVMRLMEHEFDGAKYTLSDLFKDQQRRILDRLLENTRLEIAESFNLIYEHHYAVIRMVRNVGMSLPEDLSGPAAFVLNRGLLLEIQAETVDLQRLRDLVEEILWFELKIDQKRLSFEASRRVREWMEQLKDDPNNLQLLEQIGQTLEILEPLLTAIDLQYAQNLFFEINKTHYLAMKQNGQAKKPSTRRWMTLFKQLADHLDLAIA